MEAAMTGKGCYMRQQPLLRPGILPLPPASMVFLLLFIVMIILYPFFSVVNLDAQNQGG